MKYKNYEVSCIEFESGVYGKDLRF